MAKHCSRCKREYADDLEACPFCAAADTMHPPGRGEERATQILSQKDPRATQLGGEMPAGNEPDEELVEWAADEVEIVDVPSSSPEPHQPLPSDSVVDLGASQAEVVVGDSSADVKETPSSASQVFVGEMVSDVEEVSDSGLDLSDEEAAPRARDGSSSIDLSKGPIKRGGELFDDAADEEMEGRSGSGIELEASPSPDASSIDLHPSSDSDLDLAQRPDDSSLPPSSADVVEEPAVSEKEVDDLLAGLEERPSETSGEAAEMAEQEEVLAAAEAEEEAAAAEEKKEEKPAKTAKPRSSVPALIGTACLGILLGAGGTIGTQKLMGPSETEKPRAQVPVPPVVPQSTQPSFEALQAMVASGDWEGANKAGIDTAPAAKSEELALRGQYRLGQFLQKKGPKFNNLQDPDLQPAIKDLQEAGDKNPYALYDLALIKELSGDLQGAQQEYAKGADTFKEDPVQKQRFEAALARVEWKASKAPKRAGAALPAMLRDAEDPAVMLVLLSIALQQPQAPQPNQPTGQQPPQSGQQPPQQAQPPQPGQQPSQAEKQEAGFEFWQAAKLAHNGKYSEAVQALDKARTMHEERRFSRLRKAQNPLSDPAEDIFLRCCDELKAYWELESGLRKGGYLTDKNTPQEALNALVQKASTNTGADKKLTEQLVAAKVLGKDEDVSKGITRLLSEKRTTEASLADLKLMIQAAKEENAKLDGKLKAAEKAMKDHDADSAKAKEQIAKLKTDFEKASDTLSKIRTELTSAKFLDAGENVSDGVKKVVEVAKSKDSQGTIRQQRDEITRLSSALKQSRQAEDMLPLWLLLLDENRNRPELAEKAIKDVDSVTTDPRATPVRKGEAAVVFGLALRNTDQFDRAKTVLTAARGSVDRGEWVIRADAALKDVSNPAAYFTTQAQLWYDHGQMETALAVLKRAEKVLPAKEHGKLWAQRSLIELDAARGKTRRLPSPTEPLLIAARKDAEAAAKAGLAEGHYAAGRIAEELGELDTAIKSYRAALAAYGNRLDAQGSRYRMALARVLLAPREAQPIQPAIPAKGAPKLGWIDPAPYPAQRFTEMRSLALALLLTLQVPPMPADEPGSAEAERLADEVLKLPPETVPFDGLAQALAVKGRWDAAWQVYVDGIRPLLPREYGDGLAYLLRNDPRLRRPGGLRTPNPLEAEKHFAAGLTFYFDRDYSNAEKEFLLTVESDSQDARFFYFLGLSRLEQKKNREANADFNEAVLLERLNRPAQPAVDEALERVQGSPRRIIDEVRERPMR